MRLDWSPLRRAVGPQTRVWWRDDDAVAETPALYKLRDLRAEAGMPVHLAIIPAHLEESLVAAVRSDPALIPLIHGWAHVSRAPLGAKKAEFQHDAPAALGDAEAALARMRAAFGAQLCPVFVPPWNRISDEVARGLGALGYSGLSTYGPAAAQSEVGVPRINTHIDPIDWRGTRSALEGQALIDRAAAQLRAFPTEPIGILTHHLVHDDAIWEIARALLLELRGAGAVPYSLQGPPDEPT